MRDIYIDDNTLNSGYFAIHVGDIELYGIWNDKNGASPTRRQSGDIVQRSCVNYVVSYIWYKGRMSKFAIVSRDFGAMVTVQHNTSVEYNCQYDNVFRPISIHRH